MPVQGTTTGPLDRAEIGTERFRYVLHRDWSGMLFTRPRPVVWVMLNPSSADGIRDDATTRRCIAHTERLGYYRLQIVNLFAYRSRDPKRIRQLGDAAVGRANDEHIALAVERAALVVCAWGAHRWAQDRAREVVSVIGSHDLWCLGTTADGSPRHPLYLPAATELVRWP